MKSLFFVFLIGLCFFQTSPQNHIDGIVAIVNNNIVLKSDVLEQSIMIAKQKNINPQKTPLVFEKIFNSVLSEKINRLVVLSAANEDSLVSVSFDEVDATLNDRINNFISIFGSEQALEDTMGLKINEIKAEYWKTIEEELLVERFRYFRFNDVSVNKEEVVSFFTNNPDSFPLPPKISNFSILQNPIEVGAQTKDSLFSLLDAIKDSLNQNLLSFDVAAKRYSQDPGSKNKGGSLGFTKRGTLLPVYEKNAFSLSVGDISNPFESVFGLHLVKLNDRVGEKIQTQHILIPLSVGEKESLFIKNKFNNYLSEYFNDPGGFDSLCVDTYMEKKNLSGDYKNFDILRLPSYLQEKLKKLSNYSFSDVFIIENSVFLLYKKNETTPKPLSLDKNWVEIENIVLNHKRFTVFSDWIKETKKTMYVKTFSY